MEHVYDFFKPNLSSPYPVVDGKFSNACYLRALDRCYQRFCAKFEAAHKTRFELARADFVVFHAPYNKLVQKSFGRLLYNDFVRAPSDPRFAALASGFGALTPEQSYADAALEKALVAMTADAYRAKVEPGTLLPREIGNTYTASLYAGLLSLVATQGAALAGRRVLMFSYGSGLASSLFSLVAPDDDATRAALERMREAAALRERLAARRRASPEEFSRCMAQREQLHDARGAFEPQEPVDSLFPGTFYLTRKDELGRRFYAQTPL
jgi:hydroxymethylglutaryl-CoA synthase